MSTASNRVGDYCHATAELPSRNAKLALDCFRHLEDLINTIKASDPADPSLPMWRSVWKQARTLFRAEVPPEKFEFERHAERLCSQMNVAQAKPDRQFLLGLLKHGKVVEPSALAQRAHCRAALEAERAFRPVAAAYRASAEPRPYEIQFHSKGEEEEPIVTRAGSLEAAWEVARDYYVSNGVGEGLLCTIDGWLTEERESRFLVAPNCRFAVRWQRLLVGAHEVDASQEFCCTLVFADSIEEAVRLAGVALSEAWKSGCVEGGVLVATLSQANLSEAECLRTWYQQVEGSGPAVHLNTLSTR